MYARGKHLFSVYVTRNAEVNHLFANTVLALELMKITEMGL